MKPNLMDRIEAQESLSLDEKVALADLLCWRCRAHTRTLVVKWLEVPLMDWKTHPLFIRVRFGYGGKLVHYITGQSWPLERKELREHLAAQARHLTPTKHKP